MADEIIIYRTDDGRNEVSLMTREGMVWLNQSQMAELFDTSKQTISYHIDNILLDRELSFDSVVKEYLTTATDGKQYSVKFYSLEMIMAVGFRIRNPRGVQFRQWAPAPYVPAKSNVHFLHVANSDKTDNINAAKKTGSQTD